MVGPRLGLVLADADGQELGPKGRHLRWFVPPRLGPPGKGFTVLHLPPDSWRQQQATPHPGASPPSNRVKPSWTASQKASPTHPRMRLGRSSAPSGRASGEPVLSVPGRPGDARPELGGSSMAPSATNRACPGSRPIVPRRP